VAQPVKCGVTTSGGTTGGPGGVGGASWSSTAPMSQAPPTCSGRANARWSAVIPVAKGAVWHAAFGIQSSSGLPAAGSSVGVGPVGEVRPAYAARP
jgi:hypothetical protein